MKKIFLFVLVLFCFVGFAQATPPASIDLSYDDTEEILSIRVKHISHRTRKHFINRLMVYKNDQEFETTYYTFQVSPKGVDKDVSIKLDAGDEVRVIAGCSKRSRKEEYLIIEAEE